MISEYKDTNLDRFWKWVIGSGLFAIIEGFISKEIVYFVLIVGSIFIASYMLIAAYIFIGENYKRKLIPWLRIRKLKKEFARHDSPFYGWKYELLVPALYFPWNAVIQMKPMPQKRWVPKRELHFSDLVLTDEDINTYHWFYETAGCSHDNFLTMHHCSTEKYMNLIYKKEGLLHICLDCQKQIGYTGVGLN